MSKTTVCLRPAQREDDRFILRVNAENVEVLSPLDGDRLNKLAGAAELCLVAEVDGVPAAFLIALREGVAFYDSENYIWFSRNYEKFLYIDRVVIDEPFRGMGVGRAMYGAVFQQARDTGVPFVTAEIDTIPYNEVSLNFHKVMGFRQVGEQIIRGGAVKVSLQEASVE